MTEVICIEDCKPYFLGPFGITGATGNGEKCIKHNKYFINKCSNGDYYICSEDGKGGAHQQPSFIGLAYYKYFVTLGEWREMRINEIIDGEDNLY